MFPARATRRPSRVKMCAINDAVVLLPFVPVTAIVVISGSSANHRFSSEVICTPLSRAIWISLAIKTDAG